VGLAQEGDWELRELGAGDRDELQALLERCADYFELVDGRAPGPDAAGELIRVRPPDTDPGDKLVVGVFGSRLAGVIDLVRGWPERGTWLIGLLLLDPDARGGLLGSALVEALDDWAAEEGARRLRVAVVEANPRALRFWRSHGFAEVPALGPGAVALERAVALRP
jgi:GNAT superfamily N-acetyltransferase